MLASRYESDPIMNRDQTSEHQNDEGHQNAWADLAASIARLKTSVRVVAESVPGELTIIGAGIEAVGFSMGDEQLLRAADKVLYCVADPATVAWLKRLRPDALDLYLLDGDDKIRYTTYMQMAEAQLYWVRQGLKVVVLFYGHPGVFVLSTHRAILIARREGHRAIMKAGACALDKQDQRDHPRRAVTVKLPRVTPSYLCAAAILPSMVSRARETKAHPLVAFQPCIEKDPS